MKKASKRIVSLALVAMMLIGSTLVVNAKTARFEHLGYTAACNVSSTSTSIRSSISTSPTSPWGVATAVYAYNARGELMASARNTSAGGSCTATHGDLINVAYAGADYYMSSGYANFLGSIVE